MADDQSQARPRTWLEIPGLFEEVASHIAAQLIWETDQQIARIEADAELARAEHAKANRLTEAELDEMLAQADVYAPKPRKLANQEQ